MRVSVLLANHFCTSLMSDHLNILSETFLKGPLKQNDKKITTVTKLAMCPYNTDAPANRLEWDGPLFKVLPFVRKLGLQRLTCIIPKGIIQIQKNINLAKSLVWSQWTVIYRLYGLIPVYSWCTYRYKSSYKISSCYNKCRANLFQNIYYI